LLFVVVSSAMTIISVVVDPGYVDAIKGKGNYVYKNGANILGDLKLTVKHVGDGEWITVTRDLLQVRVLATPLDLVRGFFLQTELMPGHVLTVNRTSRVTLPGSSIRLPGAGLPVLPARVDDASGETLRNDLLIKFDFVAEDKECPGGDGGNIVIDSQESLIAFTECKARNRIIRNMFSLMSKQEQEATS